MSGSSFEKTDEGELLVEEYSTMYHHMIRSIGVNINQLCFCGCILEEAFNKINVPPTPCWICSWCFKMRPANEFKRKFCGNVGCIYKSGFPFQLCLDCEKEIGTEIKKNDTIMYQKLQHILDLSS